MKELVEYIVKKIVLNPDDVVVRESVNGSEVMLSLRVADEDMGIVIGKKGQTIRSIRKLLTVRAMNDGVRVNLSLVDVRPATTQKEEVGSETMENVAEEGPIETEESKKEEGLPQESIPK